jgi:hypothetical protein
MLSYIKKFLVNKHGMVLFSGGYSDQCLLNNGGCDQICYNSCGRKVQCACGIGYKLAYDKKTCIGKEYLPIQSYPVSIILV